MTILAQQANLSILTSQLLGNITIKDLIHPLNTTFTTSNYATFIETIVSDGYQMIRQALVELIEKMDKDFRDSPQRTDYFYVKVRRSRTLITPIGAITFKRTIYQSRSDKSSCCYIDERLGLPKYDRYDPCVKAMIVESYADINSMIKVGQIIGDRIYSAFCLKPERERYRISRQTVLNTIRNASSFLFTQPKLKHTPDSIIIMADEKYIPMQNTAGHKQMVKAATIYESSITKHKRKTLLNKHVFLHTGIDFWDDVLDLLEDKYDFDKLKRIHILGDGASWIKAGVTALKTAKNDITFSLDRFHYRQSINRISSNPDIKAMLIDYVENDDKHNFEKLTKIIENDSELKLKSTSDNITYIKNHWRAIHNTLRHIKIPCSMEAAISHNLASQFTSVPKAYKKSNLSIYLNHRMHYLNHIDLRKLYIISRNKTKINDRIKIGSPIDLSIFEPINRYHKSSTSNWLKIFNYSN